MSYTLPLQQFQQQVTRQPNTNWLHQPIEGQWHTYTWAEVNDQARKIAAALVDRFPAGSRIGILSKNCAHWFMSDLAIMMAGMVSVPIYPTAGVSTIRYVLEHSGCQAVFAGKLDKPQDADEGIAKDILRIAMPYPTIKADHSWDAWLKSYAPLQDIAMPLPEDTMTIPYTSGSTGNPKGVVLSFANLAASGKVTQEVVGVRRDDRLVSYLPLAHITERAVIEMPSIYAGNPVYFTESLETFADDLRYIKPALFVSVPRLWTRFQMQVLAQLSDQKLQRLLSIPLVGKLLARKIRKKMGLDQARQFASGTAPISPAVLEWFGRLGINITEGWGMTETAGLSCANVPFDKQSLGTIGRSIPCVEMSLSDDGEILIRGDAVFSGYYQNPEATAEAFVDGWFRTGDKAVLESNGAYRIIGRVKEQFKTGKGKYVAPVPIESLLSASPLIEQVCVMGSGRKQPVALLVLGNSVSLPDETVRQQLMQLLASTNSDLESHERLDHLIVCGDAWDMDNGLLTPTLKLKRDQIEQRYAGLIESPTLTLEVMWESELV